MRLRPPATPEQLLRQFPLWALMNSAFPSIPLGFVYRRPWLAEIVGRWSERYLNLCGYRQMGLTRDDILEEDNELAQEALKRLTPRQRYDRIYRLRRAQQLSLQHKLLPREEWIQPEEDMPYLEPHMVMIKAEWAEKKKLDAAEVAKKFKR